MLISTNIIKLNIFYNKFILVMLINVNILFLIEKKKSNNFLSSLMS